MKNFFENLQGLIIALLFMAIPAIVIGLIALVLRFVGIDIAHVEGVIRFVVIGYFVIASIGVILRGH